MLNKSLSNLETYVNNANINKCINYYYLYYLLLLKQTVYCLLYLRYMYLYVDFLLVPTLKNNIITYWKYWLTISNHKRNL